METLWAIATALAVPFGELVSPPATDVRVLRAGAGARIDSEGSPFAVAMLAAPAAGARPSCTSSPAGPGAPAGRPHPAGVREHLLVTAGEMEVGPEDGTVTLGAGDLASFPGDVPHLYRGLAPETRAVLLMDYP